jgi:hypothetical protein
MSTPDWWSEFMAVSDVLAAEDQSEVQRWRGPTEPDDDGGSPPETAGSEPPLTLRLGALGDAFAKHAGELTPGQRRTFLGIVERVVATGTEADRSAVATGFLEALLNAYDEGFDLRSIWPDLGPESRAYCLAWNEFTGVSSPDWMREPG